MIVIQDKNKDIICNEPTLTKALKYINTKKYTCAHIREKLRESKYSPIKYKEYTISKW